MPVAAFFHSHRKALRDGDEEGMPQFLGNLTPDGTGIASATHWLNLAATNLRVLFRDGKVDPFGRLALSNRLGELAQMQAGNERIKSTPVPFVYSLLVRRTTYLYCTLLPFALVDTGTVFAALITAMVAYAFFGLQAVTNELEDPYAMNDNGLALTAICRVCDNSVLEALNRDPLPSIEPRGFVLL